MKKTDLMATISEFNPLTGKMCEFDRNVYQDENGISYVQYKENYFSPIKWLAGNGRTVRIWF